MTSYPNHPPPAYTKNVGWGIFNTHLTDGSTLIFRKVGDTEWIQAKVLDDRVYYSTAKAVNPGEIYHVTYTDKGSLDFGILESGGNSGYREYEVKLE